MMKKCFTIETRLKKSQFPLDYFESVIQKQSKMYRLVWREIQKTSLTQSKLNTLLQNRHNVDKRTANTVIQEVKGRLRALKELKKVEKNNLATKILVIKEQIEEIAIDLDKLSVLVANNQANDRELEKYRKLKASIYEKKQKLNRMNQKMLQYERQEVNGYYPICWGTKKLFKKQFNLEENGYKNHYQWLKAFRNKRDNQVNFIGTNSEPWGNQNCQLTYDAFTDSFHLKIRKDLEFMKSKDDKFIYIKELDFKYHRDVLIEVIKNRKTPFTFRILRRKKKWYVQVIFTWTLEEKDIISNIQYGAIGLDYNDGFISMAETDYYGNLIHVQHFPLLNHGSGNKAESEICETIAKIIQIAQKKEKPIVIEQLDFKKKKAKTYKAKSKKGKEYNRMIHALDYARYQGRIENACYRNGIELKKVNAAYTSQIGEQKYAYRMKLNRHQGAAYVIARRAQGYQDKLIK